MPPVSAARSVSARMRILSRAVNVRRLGRSDNSGDAEATTPSAYGLLRPPHRSVAGAWACAWLSFRALKSKFPGVWCLIIIGTEGSIPMFSVCSVCQDADPCLWHH